MTADNPEVPLQQSASELVKPTLHSDRCLDGMIAPVSECEFQDCFISLLKLITLPVVPLLNPEACLGRFPGDLEGKVSTEDLWEILEEGNKVMPEKRFNVEFQKAQLAEYPTPAILNTDALIEKPDLFDARAKSCLYESILCAAGADAHDIIYTEIHGSGIQAGNNIEANSVMGLFAPRPRQRALENILQMGAVISNACYGKGNTALVKLLLLPQNNMVDRRIRIKKTLSPAWPTDTKKKNVKIAFQKTHMVGVLWKKRVTFLGNFSAAGGNIWPLLEDTPQRKETLSSCPRCGNVIIVFAKSMSTMARNVEKMVKNSERVPATVIPDLAYTTTVPKAHFVYHVPITSSKTSEAMEGHIVK
ncbi:hypothetical protein B0O99DRAFT_716662 [Bisporella sp. PMI_857]|nr:hypothetical protein B0O99DRAFT_716662 [Bisporella sp. PMI_857]